jgi:hypothetical protein
MFAPSSDLWQDEVDVIMVCYKMNQISVRTTNQID